MGAAPGVSCTGPAAAAGRFGAGGLFAGACACVGAGAAAGGGGATERAAVAGAAAGAAFGAAPSGGSGFMMLTAGVEAEVGNSALVGLPVGIDGGSAAIMPAAPCGLFQDDA